MKLRSHLFCLIAIVIWSSLEITGKLVGAGIDPYTLTAWRFVIGGLAMLPFAIRQLLINKPELGIGSILHIGALGIINVCASMLLLQLSIFYGKASLSAVIVAMNPLFVTLFARLILKEGLNLLQFVFLLLGIFGLIMIVLTERSFGSTEYRNLPLSILLAVIASVTFGLYSVLTKSAVGRYGNLITNSLSFIIGGIVLTCVNLLIGKPVLFEPNSSNLLFMAWLGVVITGIAYLLYFEGMKHITASRASFYFFLKP
ncbi:MAG TPA: EamA family transporter, partial [Candidatus Cloacimonadota bacterium]|nr:EamA family transporter [Candidatus Cloacimonadota bacterium]